MIEMVFKKIKKYMLSPKALLYRLIILFPKMIKSDAQYLKLKYYVNFRHELNLENPQRFSEKIQWLKLYNRKPEYVKMVDKYDAKMYVASIIGDKYIIPTLAVYENVEDIDFDALPNQFVLKCTHDSGGIVICRDKINIDRKYAIKKLQKGLKRNFYWQTREWPYKNVHKRIIAEQYLEPNPSINDLPDYKFFCFNGEPRIIQLDFDRFKGHKKNLYTPEWELLTFSYNYPSHPEIQFEKPQKLEEMLNVVRKLSKGHVFLRVDLYWTGEKIYFGEMTFYPASGMGRFKPDEWDYKVGSMLQLPVDNQHN